MPVSTVTRVRFKRALFQAYVDGILNTSSFYLTLRDFRCYGNEHVVIVLLVTRESGMYVLDLDICNVQRGTRYKLITRWLLNRIDV